MPSLNKRFFIAMLLSLVLMALELQGDVIHDFKSNASVVVYPIRWSINAPSEIYSFLNGYFFNRKNIVQENQKLKEKNLYLKSQLQKFKSLEIENVTLRRLLHFSESKREDMIIANIIKIFNDPFSCIVAINKGEKHGVYVGQPVIDGNGLMGNIMEVTANTSVLLLLTDATNSVPVVNLRNGLRGITEGLGSEGTLELKYVTNTSDVKVGDKFVTSGLGGKYPEGYIVGQVIDIANSAAESFSKIILNPSANLDSSKLVLLLNLKSALDLDE